MAHVETWYRCLVCSRAYKTHNEAVKCRNKHPIRSEQWAIGKNKKGVRVFDNCTPWSSGGIKAALFEADLSDFVHERKIQLVELKETLNKEDLPPYLR